MTSENPRLVPEAETTNPPKSTPQKSKSPQPPLSPSERSPEKNNDNFQLEPGARQPESPAKPLKNNNASLLSGQSLKLASLVDSPSTVTSKHLMPLIRSQNKFMTITHKTLLNQRRLLLERVDSLAGTMLNERLPEMDDRMHHIEDTLERVETMVQGLAESLQQQKEDQETHQEASIEKKIQETLTLQMTHLREEMVKHLRDEIREEVGQLKERNEHLEQQILQQNEVAQQNDSSQKEMKDKIQQLESKIVAMTEGIEKMREELKDSEEKRVEELNVAFGKQLDEALERQKEQQQKEQSESSTSLKEFMDNSLNDLKVQSADTLTKVSSLEKTVTDNTQQVTTFKTQINEIQTSSSELFKSVNNLVKKDEDRAADVIFLKKKAQTISDDNVSNAHNVSVLDSKLRELTDAYNEFTEKDHENFEVVQANIEDVAIAHDNLRESIASLNEITASLDERVSALETDRQASARSASAPPPKVPSNSQLKWNEILTAGDCTITEDRATISRTRITDTDYVSSIGTKLFQRGEHTWKVQLKNVGKSHDMFIGVVDPSKIKVNQQSVHKSSHGWCLSLRDFKCYHNGEVIGEASGIDSMRNGDIITFVLSLSEKTLQIKMNGKEVAMITNIIAPLSPAITLGPEKALSSTLLMIS